MENKTMIKLVVGTEALFFVCLIMAFIYLSVVPGYKAGQLHALNVKSTGLFSIFLIGSSGTLYLSEKSYRKGNITFLKIWLFVTILFGLVFLAGQLKEYISLIHVQQITVSSSLFGTGFYTLTGFHSLHVIVGVIILTVIFIMSLLGDFTDKKSSVLSTAGIYWHFVDIVWIVIFFIVYVIPNTNIFK